MGAMHVLRRDVLRWIVTMNLSFPIKNIKRDFSNGFLVAEILSRYYPQEIQMHSFDYGTKLAKKRDNWEQLKKVFAKVDFSASHDEIENIVNCGPNNGIGPLLERLYGFLTHKRYKREDSGMDNTWIEMNENCESNDLCNNSMSSFTKDGCVYLVSGETDACFESALSNSSSESDVNVGTPKATCNPEKVGNLNCVSDATLERDVDGLGELNFDRPKENLDQPNSKAGYALTEVGIAGKESTVEQEICYSKPKNLSNAVERARQKDKSRRNSLVRAGPCSPTRERIVGSEATRDASLAFRSPNRQRHFKTYTLSDYKKQQPGGYVVLGKLGPDTTEELIVKRERLERMKEFGRAARNINVTQVPEARKPKAKPVSNRERALEFASKIVKPKRREIRNEEQRENSLPISNQPSTELERLEAKHQFDRQQIEAMRRDLESFLR
eukprot:Gb_11052 [translate_table: standard]